MTVPFQYQIEDANQLERQNGRAICGHDMGLGKTFISLLYANRNPECRPLIIVCPASLKWNWERECKIHFNMRAEILEGRRIPHGELNLKRNIVILNYDILPFWLPWLQTIKPQIVVFDEFHYCVNRKSKRSRAAKALAYGIPYVLGLTGTPIINRPKEIWHLCHIVKPTLFPSWISFANKFCNPRLTPWGMNYDGASNLPELNQALKGLMIRRLKKDVLTQLPAKRRVVIPMELDNAKEYQKAIKDFIGWLKRIDPGKARRATRAKKLVQMAYLKQLAGRGKLRAVFEWIDNFFATTNDKLVLFAVHKEIIKRIKERYKNICVVVDGSVKGRDRLQAVDQFQKHPKIRLFIGNIKAAGVGLNLTAASTVAFVELDWVPGAHVQAEDRCHRIGTKYPVSIYYLVAHATIEEQLCEILQKKQKVLAAVLDGVKRTKEMNVFDLLERELMRAA